MVDTKIFKKISKNTFPSNNDTLHVSVVNKLKSVSGEFEDVILIALAITTIRTMVIVVVIDVFIYLAIYIVIYVVISVVKAITIDITAIYIKRRN